MIAVSLMLFSIIKEKSGIPSLSFNCEFDILQYNNCIISSSKKKHFPPKVELIIL